MMFRTSATMAALACLLAAPAAAQSDFELMRRHECESIQRENMRNTCLRMRGEAARQQTLQRSLEEHRARTLNGVSLKGAELRALIAGKTVTVQQLNPGTLRPFGAPATTYFDRGGSAFYQTGQGGLGARWRGPWELHSGGEHVCLTRGSGLPCVGFHRARDGTLYQYAGADMIARVLSVEDGDTKGTMRELERYPQPGQAASGPSPNRPMPPSRPPPPPENRPGVLGPAMR
ncbi:hypothetical protein [Falsiroseomonas sp. CW058]|uniref:hypothetical protein n=1 Tax=Falsiroseomonas sp. CW058 TaxID=3388664 RepID=UPI003D30F89C